MLPQSLTPVGSARAAVDPTGLSHVDVIGDVHGQRATLNALLTELGYHGELGQPGFTHPDGRVPIFVGDTIDKGPESVAVITQVLDGLRLGQCLAVMGNHEYWLRRVLSDVHAALGPDAGVSAWRKALLAQAEAAKPARAHTLRQLAADSDHLADRYNKLRTGLYRLPLQLVLDGGRLVVVHASCTPQWIGTTPRNAKETNEMRSLHLFGPPRKGELRLGEEPALPEGSPIIVRGHVTVPEPNFRGGYCSVDTGAGDGISLTAMSWPEQSFTTVEVVAAPVTVAA